MYAKYRFVFAIAPAVLQFAAAIPLNATDLQSVRTAAANLTQGVLSYYHNNSTSNGSTQDWQIGLYPFPPYYWEVLSVVFIVVECQMG